MATRAANVAIPITLRDVYLDATLVFFFLMLVIPTSYRLVRGAMLAVLTLGLAVCLLKRRWGVSRTIFMWTLVMSTAGLLFMWHGEVLGAPGALRMGTVHVVWPLLYMFFIGLLKEPQTLVHFQKAVILGVLASALMGVLLVVGAVAGYGRAVASLLQAQEGIVGFYDGFVRYRLTNIPTMIYGVGFILAILSLPREKRLNWRGWTLLTWLTLFVTLLAIVLSGRRAAWLVVVLAPAIIVALMIASGQRVRMRHWFALLGLAIALFLGIRQYFDLEWSSLLREFVNAFDFSAERSASVRGVQGDALIAGWMDQPIFGHGLGAGGTVVSSIEEPWAYELVYVALLFQTGIVGIALYGAAVAWTFIAGIATVRRHPESASIMVPFLAGLLGFLIANATNPYLAKFDYLWSLFLPIAAIHVYSMKRAAQSEHAVAS